MPERVARRNMALKRNEFVDFEKYFAENAAFLLTLNYLLVYFLS